MAESVITLSVPSDATYARSVRMMAANLAVLCSMNVDEVEDARIAAEEAFVYACATRPNTVDMKFSVTEEALHMVVSLGDGADDADDDVAAQMSLTHMLLAAVSDTCEFSEDGMSLHVSKLVGGRA